MNYLRLIIIALFLFIVSFSIVTTRKKRVAAELSASKRTNIQVIGIIFREIAIISASSLLALLTAIMAVYSLLYLMDKMRNDRGPNMEIINKPGYKTLVIRDLLSFLPAIGVALLSAIIVILILIIRPNPKISYKHVNIILTLVYLELVLIAVLSNYLFHKFSSNGGHVLEAEELIE